MKERKDDSLFVNSLALCRAFARVQRAPQCAA